MSDSQIDEILLRRTFELAKQGLGQVSPNPMVGAILSKNGRIIGEGYHRGPGQPHAEVEALNSSIEDPAGATLYCNLEPCSHTNKRTPPCAPLLVSKGIKRVVISNIDCNPNVSGKGLQLLADAGIEVDQGQLAAEGEELNKSFFKFMRTGLPYIHIKIAQGLDGKIATASGDSHWISDEAARNEVHKLRFEYDAVMIGRQTAQVDNPTLTARASDGETLKVPWRIIVGNPKKLSSQLSVLNDEHAQKTIILCRENDLPNLKIPGINYIALPEHDFLESGLMALAKMSITSILVEGGATLAETLIEKRLFDKLTIYMAPIYMGQGPGPFQGRRVEKISDALRFGKSNVRILGEQAVFDLSP